MLEEVTSFLPTNKNKKLKIFDSTFGGGSYSLRFFDLGHEIFASDLDEFAKTIIQGTEKLQKLEKSKRFTLYHGNYSEVLNDFEDSYFDAIVADLGFSTIQLTSSNRGFSYQKQNEVLDLRYDQSSGEACFYKISKLKDYSELSKIIYTYSGEALSNKIAKVIFGIVKVERRSDVLSVVNAIDEIIFSQNKKNFNSILSRVWQALRIWTNDEFGHLEKFLETSIKKLNKNGRLIIVDFHSLEDKIITNFFRKVSKKNIIDDYGNFEKTYEHLTNKPVLPTEKEILENKPSRSAKLRVLEKLIN